MDLAAVACSAPIRSDPTRPDSIFQTVLCLTVPGLPLWRQLMTCNVWVVGITLSTLAGVERYMVYRTREASEGRATPRAGWGGVGWDALLGPLYASRASPEIAPGGGLQEAI